MDVHIDRDWVRRRVLVFVLRRGPMSTGAAMLPSGGWVEWNEREQPAPMLDMPMEVWDAIAEAAAKEPLPIGSAGALAEALKDTREVRDRLLTMLEFDYRVAKS